MVVVYLGYILRSIYKQPDLIKTGIDLLGCDKQEHWSEFVEFTKEFDAVAGTDLATVYPEIGSALPVQKL